MTIQMKAEDLDCFLYEEQYRVRWVDGEPEEYDYCFWYLQNGNQRFELDPRNAADGTSSFPMNETPVLVEFPDHWFPVVKEYLSGSVIRPAAEYKIV